MLPEVARAGQAIFRTRAREQQVVACARTRWGESPVAFVARNADGSEPDELMRLCREQLAGYKRPREIRFIASTGFPRSTSGKIQRHVLEPGLRAMPIKTCLDCAIR